MPVGPFGKLFTNLSRNRPRIGRVMFGSLSGWLLRGNIRAVTADVLAAPSDGDALKLRYTTDLRSGDYAAVDRSTALIALQVIVDRHPALLRCFTIAKAKIPIPIRRHTIVLASNESSDLYALR